MVSATLVSPILWVRAAGPAPIGQQGLAATWGEAARSALEVLAGKLQNVAQPVLPRRTALAIGRGRVWQPGGYMVQHVMQSGWRPLDEQLVLQELMQHGLQPAGEEPPSGRALRRES